MNTHFEKKQAMSKGLLKVKKKETMYEAQKKNTKLNDFFFSSFEEEINDEERK